ncbi:MAG: tRNA 2-thiouridine(34) synthase MnmA, partial [Planctomycetaceae bacterium]
QEICFVPDQDYAGFIRRYRGEQDTAGDLVDTAGNVVGQHAGFEKYTIGQRRGLGVAFGEPRYVVALDAATRRVIVGTRADLDCRSLTADRLNWLVPDLADEFDCLAQIRYSHDAAPARASKLPEGRIQVEFSEPQFGVAPGQAVVLYAGDRVLGGGWICARPTP